MRVSATILLPLREKVARAAGRMRGRTSGRAADSHPIIRRHRHPSSVMPSACHLLPQGEKGCNGAA